MDLIQRYCACPDAPTQRRYGPDTPCGRCGLRQPKSGWSVEALRSIKTLMREHGSLAAVAQLTGRTAQDCNLALDTMLGRTPIHALAWFEARERQHQQERPA